MCLTWKGCEEAMIPGGSQLHTWPEAGTQDLVFPRITMALAWGTQFSGQQRPQAQMVHRSYFLPQVPVLSNSRIPEYESPGGPFYNDCISPARLSGFSPFPLWDLPIKDWPISR